MVCTFARFTFISRQLQHFDSELKSFREHNLKVLGHAVDNHQRGEGTLDQVFEQVIEIAKFTFCGILLARLSDIGAVLKCADENLLDAKPFAFKRKRELENLNRDMTEWIMRLKLIFYDVQPWFGP